MIHKKGLAELFGRRRFDIKPGLTRIEALLARYHHPEQSFAAIHIVGTNGKGSTAAFLSAILTQAGFTTGLFTSPHLVSYTERFRVNGAEISDAELAAYIEELLTDASSQEATFFELTTALACRWFSDRQVQLAVLEAGMGGRSDATAAVPGILTVITPISLDHCQWLGNTLGTIASEKCGIARPDTTVISSVQPPEVLARIEQHCSDNRIRLLLAGRDFFCIRDVDGCMVYRGSALSLSGLRPALAGHYQLNNAAVAIAAAEQLQMLGFTITSEAVSAGLSQTSWPGRLERIALDSGAELLLDGAHNPAGAQALATELALLVGRRVILLLGMMEDKDPAGLLAPLLAYADQVITTTPAQERAMSAVRLAEACSAFDIRAEAIPQVSAALAHAKTIARTGDLIVAAGSLFLIGEIKALLANRACDAVRG